jgi:hypothetical protein
MRVLRDVGAPVSVLSSDSHGTCRLYSSSHVGINQIPKEMDRFPSTIKKKGEQRASVVPLSLTDH